MIARLSRQLLLSLSVGAVLVLAPFAAQAQLPSELLSGQSADSGSALPAGRAQPPRAPAFNLPTANEDKLDPFAIEEEAPPQDPAEVQRMIREQALSAALTGLLPMNPDEIRSLLERFDDTQQAVEVPVYPYPEPEVVVETVSLDPGAKPPVIKVGVGHVTTLTVLDATGAPWPIQDMTFAGNFEVIQPDEGSHVVRITGMSEFGYGNISVLLSELKTPVTFTLKTSRDSVHYRFDARIPEYGPYANVPLIDGGLTISAGNSVLGSVLDGVPPSGAEKLDVTGVDGRTTAYAYQDKTYVRTPLTLLSPGWSGSVSSADGMNVYAIAPSPVLLLSDHGQVVRAGLDARGSVNEQ
ncbi:MAG: type IV secretion protein DotH [Rhodospirillales bacterium]|nr:type IV secretion protein DotH [Rhodospirillales bacterium]MCB9996961.1 type IV secretion protein DotH [Rhodospirillales bacterium]